MIEFGQPAAFWTGLAVGLPILAHMAYRRITDRHEFTSIRFITVSQIPRTGRRTPTDIALLLLRILLFLVIMFLLADPYWSSPGSPTKDAVDEEILIAIDLSPSMGGWNAMKEVKIEASKIIEGTDSRIGVIVFGQTSVLEWPMGTNKNELLDKVGGLVHGWGSGDAQVLLDRVDRIFGENALQKKLIVISDFQRGDWQSVDFDLSKKNIQLEVIRVGSGESETFRFNNQSIADVKVVPAGPEKVRVWSVVRNWSQLKKLFFVELVIGGEVQGRQAVEIPSGSSQQVQFIVPSSEVSQAKIRLDSNDSLALDNQRTVWLKAPPPKQFGFWQDSDLDEATRSEKNFLKTAVESAGDNGWNRWEESADNADGLRMAYEDSKLELLMVLGLSQWFTEEGLAEPLSTYLKSGGVVILTPSEIFSETASIIREANWFKFSFIRVAGGASAVRNPFRIGALEEGSKLSDTFSGKSARDLYLTAFRKFGILNGVDDTTDIALRDREGRPLSLSKSFASGGRLIFFPFRLNTSWSDLPLRTSFLPLLMELIRKENGEDQAWPILEPGEQFGAGEQPFVAEKPGVYRHGGKWIEVVFPSAESVVDTVTDDEILNRLSQAVISEKNSEGVESASINKDKNSLWLWFAIIAATLLTIEMIWSRPIQSVQNKKGVSNA